MGRMIRNRPIGRQASRLAGATAIALAAGFVTGGCHFERLDADGAPVPDEGPDLAEQVASLLDRQAAAWNAGDLDGFMSAYSPSPTTTYIGSTGLIEGYDGIRERYAPGFAEGAERDSLRFEALRVREVDERVGLATARYVLEREGTVTSTGPFTLVLLNVEGAWLIVHDQSAEDGGG